MTEREFNKVFEENKNAVYLYAHSKLNNSADAEDVVSLAFLSLWDHRHKIQSLSHAQCFVRESAKHKVIDELRARRRSPFVLFNDIIDHEQEELDMIEAEVIAKLYCIIEQMAPRSQSVLKMAVFQRLPAAKISERLGITINSVYTTVQRSIETVRFSFLNNTSPVGRPGRPNKTRKPLHQPH